MNVMIDIETFGLAPGSTIKTLGAVKFGIVDGKQTIFDRFYRRIDVRSSVAAGLVIDGPTVKWWLGQSDEARKEMSLPGEPLLHVITAFELWVKDPETNIWGNGAAYDNVLLAVAAEKVGRPASWAHRKSLCYRTIKNANRDMPIDPYRVGTHHNAVDDAESQAMHLMAIWARDAKRIAETEILRNIATEALNHLERWDSGIANALRVEFQNAIKKLS